METSKILSANWLDLLFDERNKAYGAYDLRKTYHRRITKALLITAGIATIVFTGTVLASSLRPKGVEKFDITQVNLIEIPKDEPKPLPEPEKKPKETPVRTEKLTTPVLAVEVTEPPPTQEDLVGARIDVVKHDGPEDAGLADVKNLDDGKGLVEGPRNDEPQGPFERVEIDAKFTGNWTKFLERYLQPDVPVDNGAPPGRHTVVIQFVVDIDGSVSDIRPLTSIGYGMEEEAMRVIKKAAKWEPAIQNGRKVKAYRKQPVTFEVLNN